MIRHLLLVALLVSSALTLSYQQQPMKTSPTRWSNQLAGSNSALGVDPSTKGLTPSGLLCADDGYVYIYDASQGGLLFIKMRQTSNVVYSNFGGGSYGPTLSGTPHALAYSTTPTGLNYVYHLDPDSTNLFYREQVSDSANGGSFKVEVSGKFTNPYGLAITPEGDMFFSDSKDMSIRKVNTTAGEDGKFSTTIIAGLASGVIGYGGENVLATNVTLSTPKGMAIFERNLYFAEATAHIIRKLDLKTLQLSTVVGVPTDKGLYNGEDVTAFNVSLNSPSSIAFAANGDMIISDSGNHRIRKVSNGRVTTIAGNGTAGFYGDGFDGRNAMINNPTTVSVARNGDVYFIDSGNFRVRKISNLTGIITTIAGNGLSRNYGENVHPSQSSLNQAVGFTFSLKSPYQTIYVADSGNNRIRSFASLHTPKNIETVAGQPSGGFGIENVNALSSNFNFPTNLVFHPVSGDLLIVDTENHRIRRMNNNSIVQTFVGNGIKGFNGDGFANSTVLNSPTGIGVLSSGEIIFSDTGNNLVRMINLQGFVSSLSINVSSPVGIAITPNDEILIGDSGYHRILRCTKQSVCVTVVGSMGVKGHSPFGYNNAIPVSSVYLNQPTYVAISKAGDIYVTDYGNLRLLKIARDGMAGNLWTPLVNPGNILFNEYEKKLFYMNNNLLNLLWVACPGNYTLSPSENECNLLACSGIAFSNSSVCSSRGTCTAMNTCVCSGAHFGQNCEFKLCNGASIPSSQECIIPQTPSAQETKVETVQLTSLNAKNVTFEKFQTIQVTFPVSFVSQLNSSGAISGNLNIDLVSSVSNQTLDVSLNSLSENNTILLVSSIVTISIFDRENGKEISVSQLTEPINIQMQSITIPNSLLQDREFAFVCMFLDTATNTWKTDGVETIIQNKQNNTDTFTFSTLCRTSHLTSFAVIDPNYKKANINPKTTDSGAMDVATIVGIAVGGGAGLVIVCTMMILLVVLVVVCCVKKRK